jgi:hypothetical protein
MRQTRERSLPPTRRRVPLTARRGMHRNFGEWSDPSHRGDGGVKDFRAKPSRADVVDGGMSLRAKLLVACAVLAAAALTVAGFASSLQRQADALAADAMNGGCSPSTGARRGAVDCRGRDRRGEAVRLGRGNRQAGPRAGPREPPARHGARHRRHPPLAPGRCGARRGRRRAGTGRTASRPRREARDRDVPAQVLRGARRRRGLPRRRSGAGASPCSASTATASRPWRSSPR